MDVNDRMKAILQRQQEEERQERIATAEQTKRTQDELQASLDSYKAEIDAHISRILSNVTEDDWVRYGTIGTRRFKEVESKGFWLTKKYVTIERRVDYPKLPIITLTSCIHSDFNRVVLAAYIGEDNNLELYAEGTGSWEAGRVCHGCNVTDRWVPSGYHLSRLRNSVVYHENRSGAAFTMSDFEEVSFVESMSSMLAACSEINLIHSVDFTFKREGY